MNTRVLVPSGVLGLGFDRQALAAGVALKPDVICIDGGSTDSGPFSLGTSTSKYSRAACVAEWRDLMAARAQLNVPLIIGSAGTCGTDDMVDWMLDITRQIATEQSDANAPALKVALLYSEQQPSDMAQAFRDKHITALQPDIGLDEATITNCAHIVALAGAEHIQAALETGADIIIAGRTTDTAIVSALPIMQGCHEGASWHAAKIAECGALCSTHPTSGVIIVEIDESGFTIFPTAKGARCTPHSVSAHMLYENTDPFVLYEPGGYLDVHNAEYHAIDERTVRVSGSKWVATLPYTLKLEGAKLVGYQSTLIALLRDAHYVSNASAWVSRLSDYLNNSVQASLDLKPDDFFIEFRLIGVDATLGELETRLSEHHEIGVLVIVTAQTQDLCDEIAKIINPFLLHYPLTDDEPLPTFAFPYSPAQSSRGPLYEFCLNHIVSVETPLSATRLVSLEISTEPTA